MVLGRRAVHPQAGQVAADIARGLPQTLLIFDHGDTHKAFAILARLYVEAQQIESAKALLERLPESLHKDADVASVLAAIANAERAADLGQTNELQRKIQQDPNNFQAYFDLALALNAENKRDEAAQALLEIIRRDRNWQDDGARKQLVQFFEAWCPMDSAAVQARRKLSGLLFS